MGTEVRSDVDSLSEDGERVDTSVEKGPEFIFRKLLRQASSLVEVSTLKYSSLFLLTSLFECLS